MADTKKYRALSQNEIDTLIQCGCSVERNDWTGVQVADGFDAHAMVNVRFGGQVRLGSTADPSGGDAAKWVGIRNACVIDSCIGDGVCISNIGVRIANYSIEDGACIEDVGTLETRPGARFGNGVEIEVLNEGGGREVMLFDALSSQFAHMVCLHRYRPAFVAGLQEMARNAAARAHRQQGRIGTGASIRSVVQITDVHIGSYAEVHGATSLVNGSILSCQSAPARVGPGVQADSFIIAEGAQVDGAAMVSTSYVGQGSRVGRQFSAEGTLMFANCEAFHGEACSVFAGPYSVTHHKGSLLIAGLFSFYNAGSGTNQSNHMYKLGPVHEGRLERGSKTGSFSYVMWPCRVGPFSVVLGKHTRAFDTADFPFSHIEALPDGRCSLIPGFNLTTVGTVRDGAKWPTRDRRQGPQKRDRLSFDVFSPYTAGRMIRGMRVLKEYQDKTDRSVKTVAIGGAEVKRVFLRTGQKYYRRGVMMYLTEKVIARVESALARDASIDDALQSPPAAVYSERWVDIGGQLMPSDRLEQIMADVENGSITELSELNQALDETFVAYDDDEWVWVKTAYEELTGTDLDQADAAVLQNVADELLATRKEFLDAVLVDAVKEFDRLSAIGFGSDGPPDAVAEDFKHVRGDYDSNNFVIEMREEIEALSSRISEFKARIMR